MKNSERDEEFRKIQEKMEVIANSLPKEKIILRMACMKYNFQQADNLNELFRSRLAEAQNVHRTLQNRNQGLSMELQEAKNTIFHLNIEINILRENIEAFISELETYQETCTDQEWDIANKLAVIDFSKGKIETLETQIRTLKGILERKEETIVSLQKELTAAKQENLKQLSLSNTLSGEVERQEEEFKKLRLGIIAKQQKLDAQQEWNAHLTAEITRLLAYEKSTKAIITKWNHPKIWDVWNLFLKWLFPTDQKPSSQLARQLKEEYRKQHKEKF